MISPSRLAGDTLMIINIMKKKKKTIIVAMLEEEYSVFLDIRSDIAKHEGSCFHFHDGRIKFTVLTACPSLSIIRYFNPIYLIISSFSILHGESKYLC